MKLRPNCRPTSAVCTGINAANALLRVMEALSYEMFNSPWAPHLDRRLWKEMSIPKTIPAEDANTLRYLHMQSGGWWSWQREETPGPTFVPTAVWLGVIRDGE